MARSGYIKLYRTIKENFLWKDKPFTKGQAWVDIMLEANHADGGFFKRGVWVEVKRGQDGRAELTLADEWGWSRGKVRRFLATLKKEQMITLKQDNKTTIITICNYELYQPKKNVGDTPNSTADSTPNGHQTDTKRYTNNKKENVKKNKNDNISSKKRTKKPKTDPPELDKIQEFMDTISEATKKLCREKNIGQLKFKQLAESCFDHFRGKGEQKADWQATVRNWVRNDEKFNSGNQTKTDDGSAKAKELEEQTKQYL